MVPFPRAISRGILRGNCRKKKGGRFFKPSFSQTFTSCNSMVNRFQGWFRGQSLGETVKKWAATVFSIVFFSNSYEKIFSGEPFPREISRVILRGNHNKFDEWLPLFKNHFLNRRVDFRRWTVFKGDFEGKHKGKTWRSATVFFASIIFFPSFLFFLASA